MRHLGGVVVVERSAKLVTQVLQRVQLLALRAQFAVAGLAQGCARATEHLVDGGARELQRPQIVEAQARARLISGVAAEQVVDLRGCISVLRKL